MNAELEFNKLNYNDQQFLLNKYPKEVKNHNFLMFAFNRQQQLNICHRDVYLDQEDIKEIHTNKEEEW